MTRLRITRTDVQLYAAFILGASTHALSVALARPKWGPALHAKAQVRVEDAIRRVSEARRRRR